ncbi:MAG: flagellar biosynthetic protein FliR [Pirellulaceae bacterium]|nr:flagellar biosynthetic protein FliR [Pirellulaceae bacterium]
MITAPVFPLLIPLLLIFTRISSTLLLLPSFSLVTGSIRIKLLLSAMAAVLLTPLYIQGELLAVAPDRLLFMFESELLLGFACGLSGRLIISGLHMGGQLVGQVSGITLSEFTLADESTTTIHGRLLVLIGLSSFLVMGGHRQVVQALLDSFQVISPGAILPATPLADLLRDTGGLAFQLSVRITAPILLAMLTALIAVAMLNRTLPQLNIMAIGHNLNALLLFVVLLFSVGGIAWIFQDQMVVALEHMQQVLRNAATT